MAKLIIVIVLVVIIIVGFFGFWYHINQQFSKEILKLEIFGPTAASVGDEIIYTVTYKNNGNFVLQSPKLIFEIPDNSLTEDGKNRFQQNLLDIAPGGQDSIQFKTRLLGKEGDVKTAHAWLSYIPKNLSARYESDAVFTTKIDTVPITLDFNLPPSAQRSSELSYTINYFSNIDYPLENVSVKIDTPNGFIFKSANPTSLDNAEWKLSALNKAQGGKITIRGVINTDANSLIFAAHLGIWQDGVFVIIKDANQEVALTGNYQAQTPIPTPTLTPVPAPVSIPVPKPSSHLTISQKAYHGSDEAFVDSGPIPPQIGVPTTYTVTWQITDDLNDVQNVKVEAVLPQNVTLAAIFPESQIANISLDSQTHRLVWAVGNISAGTGINSPPPFVSFQVTLAPSKDQQGKLAGIIGQATISGQDQVTGVAISGTAPAVNTNLPDDSTNSGGGIVQ